MKKIVWILFLFVGFQSVKAQSTQNKLHKPSTVCYMDTSNTPKTLNTGKPYIIVEQMPTFPGGQDSLTSYLKKHTVYPYSAKTKKIEGTIYVSFVISDKGTISQVKILRGITNALELDAEALKVIKEMPNWIPPKQDGKNVATQMSLPIKFILRDNK
ncbi:MAG: energy transducer TonB [Bacteroidia bacterium]